MAVSLFNISLALESRGIVKSEQNLPIANAFIVIQDITVVNTNNDGVFVLPNRFSFQIEITLKHPDYESINAVFTETNQQFYLKESIQTESLNTILINTQNEKKSMVITPT